MIVEYKRVIIHKLVSIGFFLVGLGCTIGGLATMSTATGEDTARTALLLGFGALGLVVGVGTWFDIAKKRALDERLQIFADRVDVRSTRAVVSYPFAELKSIEGRITTYQNTGARVCSYKLTFSTGVLELSAGEFVGINEETGALVVRHSGREMEPWL